jgi:TolB-like protein/tetratricopeptide (TPR) repeat protein
MQTPGSRSLEPVPGPTATRDAFISYASQDTAIANAVVAALERHGLKCWIAPRDVRAGALYADEIIRAINDTNNLVLVLSASAIASTHVGKEVERASSKRRPIVTLRIDAARLTTALEYFLSESQWIDLVSEGTEAAFAKLVAALGPRQGSGACDLTSPPHEHGRARPNRPAAIRRKFWPVMAAAALIVVGLALFMVDRTRLSRRPESSGDTAAAQRETPGSAPASPAVFAPPPHSIAVLPFVNMSGDAAEEYFSDGITEELLNSLTGLNDLQVMARTSSFSFKGQNVDIATIARRLNVGAILEGSVRRAGNKVRITVQLINAVNGFHLWSQTYDRDLTNILKVQSDVARAVAMQLEVKLVGDEAEKIELGGTRNAEAYDAYLRGIQATIPQGGGGKTLRDALADFDRAIALDPNFAKAYAERAWTLHGIAVGVHNPEDREGLRAQARAAAERAVTLAPNLGEAHAALASIRAYALFDYIGAGPEFERALALSPGSASVQGAYAWYAADLGHFDQAIGAARRAVSLDPQNAFRYGVLGAVFSYARRYDEALTAYEHVKALRPEYRGIGWQEAMALLASGKTEQARQTCESPGASMDEDDRHQCLALAYHYLGRQKDAERELIRFQTLDGDSAAYSYACVHAQWGDVTGALQWLTKAEKLRDPLLWLLKVDWRLDPLRNEGAFKAVVARMNFPP